MGFITYLVIHCSISVGHFVTKKDELQTHIGQWMQLHQKYGSDLRDAHVKTKLHNTMPATVLAEIRKMKEFDTLQKWIAWVYNE